MTIVYHGDHYGTTKIDLSLMGKDPENETNGIGMYFTPDLIYAKHFGPKICAVNTSGLNIFDRYTYWNDIISEKQHKKFVKTLQKYGFDEDDFNYYFFKFTPKKHRDIVLYQIGLVSSFDTNYMLKFLRIWNKIAKIDGFYVKYDSSDIPFKLHYPKSKKPKWFEEYIITNPKVKVTPVNF